MTDLSLICGLPIQLDEDTNNIFYGEKVKFDNQIEIALEEIIPVLLNKYLKYPERVYKHYENVSYFQDEFLKSNNVSYDVIQIPYGLLGIEFVKTHVYYSDYKANKYDCIVEVIKGQLTVLVQRNSEEEDDEYPATLVDEIQIIKVKEGEKLAIPTGVFYTFVNTGSSNVIFSIVASKNHKPVNYQVFDKEKGMAFYIISKNARLEVVANPKYKLNCKAQKITLDKMEEDLKERYLLPLFSKDEEPLYNILKTKLKEIEEIIKSY